MAPSPKEFDVIVYGATGFTGALVARYLLEARDSAIGSEQTVKWAIAGRSAAKLDKLKEELKTKVPTVAAATIDAVPTVVADSSNEAQLVEMVKKTKVVLTVVGPYKLYGEPVVKACAENGVHYCDLAGETIWISKMVAKYDAEAKKTGAVLVNCCGFDSVPSDLTAFLLADAVKHKRQGSSTSKISLYFTTFKGEASGGTLNSVCTIIGSSTNAELMAMQNPFFLTDEATRQQKKTANLVAPNSTSYLIRSAPELGSYSSMFVGAAVDQVIVHRSNYILDNAYGENFIYTERNAEGGWLWHLVFTIGMTLGSVLLYFGPTRALIRLVGPKPGDGPSEKAMVDGKFVAKAFAYDEAGVLAVKATTVGVGDPGYAMTSRVISECAFCLAKGQFGLSHVSGGGFFTPASAFGHELAQRLSSKNIMKVTIEDA